MLGEPLDNIHFLSYFSVRVNEAVLDYRGGIPPPPPRAKPESHTQYGSEKNHCILAILQAGQGVYRLGEKYTLLKRDSLRVHLPIPFKVRKLVPSRV